MRDVSVFLEEVTEWATRQPGVRAVALVGSHARGDATATSDVDIIVVVDDTQAWLTEPRWVEHFGGAVRVDREDWGMVQSLRVRYPDGLEVELGITSPV